MDMKVRSIRFMQAALSELTVLYKRKDSTCEDGFLGNLSRAGSIGAEWRRKIANKASAMRWEQKMRTAYCGHIYFY
jgi:hypothetical protein